jgi:hypothetical protein
VIARRLVAGWFLLEAVGTAVWIATLLPTMADRDLGTWILVGARGGVGALEMAVGVMLGDLRAAVPANALWLPIASAALVVFEVGFRLAPTNLDPTFRWWFVGAYGMAAALIAGWLSQRR